MGTLRKNIQYLGTTKSGKYIHPEPQMNEGFKKQDHLDAYQAHAIFLMKNQLIQSHVEQHRLAMNKHYLLAVSAN